MRITNEQLEAPCTITSYTKRHQLDPVSLKDIKINICAAYEIIDPDDELWLTVAI